MNAVSLPSTASRSFRAESRRLARLQRGIGRDLIEVLYGGWLEENETLWERYGNPSVTPSLLPGRAGNLLHSDNAELRVYAHVAGMVSTTMRTAGAGSRAGTEYRVASTVIWELSGAGSHTCKFCGGSGRACRGVKRCRRCGGSGIVHPSNSTRAAECGCRQPEFLSSLLGVYLTVLSGARRELSRALSAYERS